MRNNRSLKKILSIIVTVILTLTSSPAVFSAYEKAVIIVSYESAMYDPDNNNIEWGAMPNQYATFGDNSEWLNYSCYSLLNPFEKMIYDRILNAPFGEMSITMKFSPTIPKADFDSIDFRKVMNAFCDDHPEIFYYNGYGLRYYTEGTTNSVFQIDYVIASQQDSAKNPIYTPQNIPELNNLLKTEFAKVPVDLSNRYNFVKSVHDYLVDNITYDMNNPRCFDICGALIDKKAVCQGYAETFKMFCDYYSIPCIYISGTGITQDGGGAHGWNAVQMDDGKWYLTDVTWDDPLGGNRIFYDFFLVGLNTKPVSFVDQTPFGQSHIPDKGGIPSTLNYAQEKYAETNHNTLFKATYNSFADYQNNIITLAALDAPKHNIYYHGMKVDVNGKYTGAKFTVNGNEEWQMVLLGDVNGDGLCDVNDYGAAANMALNISPSASQTSFTAADVCKDNVIDVLDLVFIQNYSLGGITDLSV